MSKLGDLQGTAVDPDETEEEREKRIAATLHRAQEEGSDYGSGFHTGEEYLGSDGWMYRKMPNGSARKMRYVGKVGK